MARIKSLIKFEGTIDGLTIVRTKKNRLYVRKKSSLTAERVKTDPKFGNFRNSGSEFGQCSTISRQIRTALGPLLKGYSKKDMHNRLLPFLKLIQPMDTVSPKGERSLSKAMRTPEGQALWKKFSFTTRHGRQSECKNGFQIDEESRTITLPGWTEDDNIWDRIPAATHIQLKFAWLPYSFEGESTPAIIQETSYRPLYESAPPVPLPFPIPAAPQGITTIFLSTHYYKEMNGQYYPLSNQAGRVLAVVGVVNG